MTLFEALNDLPRQGSGWPLPSDCGEPAAGTAPDTLRETVLPVAAAELESRQGKRSLTVATWITVIAATLLGAVNLLIEDWISALSLLMLAALCTLVFPANRRFGQRAGGVMLSVLILLTTTVNLVDGYGLHDIGMITYPVFLIFGGMVLSKRFIAPLTLACFASLSVVAALDLGGFIHSVHPLEPDDLLVAFVLLSATAVMVWISLDNVERNIQRIRRSEADVRLAYERTLEAWGRALEYRDRETEGHSRRVTELAVRLGRELDLDQETLTRLRWGALLHDIGKLAVPDAILLKPGPLNADERRCMMLHPVYARDMLAGIPFLRSVVNIPYHHHERWDGGGYPEGLRGEEIPLSARIFAVVDQWEALSSDRPYRKAWDRGEVLAYMEAEAGKAFDPRIVRVFLDRVAEES